MKKRYLLSLCMAVLLAVELQAKVVLPALLCDNMVVQQNSVVCLWGKSEFNDGEKTTVRNVMAGEVWICAGQSNMDMPMSGYPGQPVNGALEAVVEAKEYPVHVFMVNRKLSKQTEEQCEGKWEAPSAESVMHSSATAYFFAKNLQKSLQVPVGIIVSAWGGTSILSWMSEKSVNTLPSDVTKACVERDSREQNLPGRLFNAMIHPLKNYTAKGFIWYQGEHNLQEHLTYDVMMKTMVDEWRNSWNDKKNEMPFYFVQIAPYRYFNNSMEIEIGSMCLGWNLSCQRIVYLGHKNRRNKTPG